MRMWLTALAFISTVALGQSIPSPVPGPAPQEGAPSIQTASELPLSYVGGDDRISIGIDKDGKTQGELMGVFARNDAHAVIAQVWWDHGGAGGFQTDYNWLLGVTPEEARKDPDLVTVAKLSFAMNQDQLKNRQAALAFAIERQPFFLNAYVAVKASSAHSAGDLTNTQQTEQDGTDAVGNFIQNIATTTTTQLQSQPYNYSAGLHGGHFSDALGARFNAGIDYDKGNQGAHDKRASIGIDKYIGTRGWSVSGVAEHADIKDPMLGNRGDNRWWLMLRYEFGGNGAFVRPDNAVTVAWIDRALGNPVTTTPHTLRTYVSRGKVTTTTTPGTKHYVAHRPVAQNDAASVAANSVNNAIDVLANDSDADGNPITITSITQPVHGAAQIAGTQIDYTPSAGYAGSDQLTYTISDNKGLTATASVNLTVVANPPPAARNDSATTAYDMPVTIDVLANDTDPGGFPLAITSVTNPANGTSRINGNAVVYTPQPTFYGMDTFSYTVSDGHGGNATATVSVTVQQPGTPDARNDTAATAYNTPVAINVLGNDSDPSGFALNITSITNPAHGTAQRNGNEIAYAPQATFSGTDTFSYTVSNGHGGTASALVTVNVAAPGAPVAQDDSVTTAYDTPVTIHALANDSDPNGLPITIQSVANPAHGTAQISGDSIVYTPQATYYGGADTFAYVIGDGRGGTATAVITVNVKAPAGPIANSDTATTGYNTPVTINVLANDSDPNSLALSIASVTNPANGTAQISSNAIVYTPQQTFYGGTDTFSYNVSNGHGGTATATVTVSVTAPPGPVANNDTATTAYNTPVTVNVLANDSDPNGFALSIASLTNPAHGTAQISGNVIIYTPQQTFYGGTDTFSYTTSDGHGGAVTATVIVTVSLPAPPKAPNYTATLNVCGGLFISLCQTVNVLAGASDPNGFPLSVSAVGSAAHGSVTNNGNGTITYAEGVSSPSDDAFTYTVSDGHGGTATGTVTLLRPSYTVNTAIAPAGSGTVSPTMASVKYGDTVKFTLTPSPTYEIDTTNTNADATSPGACGGSVSGSTFTTSVIGKNCTVTAAFVGIIQ